MATLAPTYSTPTSPSFSRRRKSWFRRCERICCSTLSYFPLCFVYGLTTWACWFEVKTSLLPSDATSSKTSAVGLLTAALGFALYALAVTSYTIAVFTDPGSPLNPPRAKRRAGRGGAGGGGGGGGVYSSLPTHEPQDHEATDLAFTSLTAKSDGQARYCKKCAVTKPDRAHHCSTCNRCVLKMDHHCPWLATCVGMYNYKAFLLFLIYTSLFCWVSFLVSSSWVWREVVDDSVEMDEGMLVFNVIMLAVLSGIIGLVLSGFTAWHIYLAIRGQTTIESLEKTRYLSPLKKSMERQFRRHGHGPDGDRNYLADESHDDQTLGEQLKEIHANALPGVTRPEEGTGSYTPHSSVSPSPTPNAVQRAFRQHTPAQASLSSSYAALERNRERDRYSAYLDEKDSEKLPHAFNLGWRRNLRLLFGPVPLLWALPVCNTDGDGWTWEVSAEWVRRRDDIAEERKRRDAEEEARSVRAGWGGVPQGRAPQQEYWDHDYNASGGDQRDYYDGGQGGGVPPWHNQNQPNQTPWTPSWAEADDDDENNDEGGNEVTADEQAARDDEYDRGRYLTTTNGVASVPRFGRRSPNKADVLLGRPSGVFNDGNSQFHSSLSPAASSGRSRRRSGEADEYDTSSDEADSGKKATGSAKEDWNDIPEDMFMGRPRSKVGRRTKGD